MVSIFGFQFDGELEGRLDKIIQKVLLGEDFSDHYQCHSKERFIVLCYEYYRVNRTPYMLLPS